MFSLLRSACHALQSRPSVKPIACASIALFIAGCTTAPTGTQNDSTMTGTPVQTAVESTQLKTLRSVTTQQDRLYNVAAPLLVTNAQLCKGNARNLIGFSAKNKYSYSDDYVQAAQALGLGEQLQVTGVLSNSGAARAGVMRGDILASVEDKPMPQGPNAEREAAATLGPLVAKKTSVKLGLIRANRTISVTVPLTLACGFGIELGNVDNVNAYSDGRRVLVTRGMLNYVRSDTELAYVLARELAHNAMRHATRQRMTATAGGIIDNLIRIAPDTSTFIGTAGIKPMPADLDAAADTYAMYMLTRAGYNTDGAAAFWQRLATQYPATILNGYTALHPSTDARIAAINKAQKEIRNKQAARGALLP